MSTSRYKRLAKEGAWVVLGQGAVAIGSLVLVRVLTEYLDPMEYGELALGLTVAMLVNQVVMGGLSSGIGRFYSVASESNSMTIYLKASLRLMGYATAVIVVIALLIMACLLRIGKEQWMGLLALVLLYSVLSGYNTSLSGIQNAARQRAIVAFHGGIDAWLKILLAVGVMMWVEISSTAVVLGYVMSLLLVTGSQLYFLKPLIRDQKDEVRSSPSWERKIFGYSWPFSTWGVFTWAQQVSDRWSLQTFTSTEDVGLYAVVFQLGFAPIALVTGTVMTFLAPILYQRSGNLADESRNASVHRIAWRVTTISLILTGSAFIFSFFVHELIFKILVAVEYRAVSYLLPWMVLAGGIFSAAQILALKLMSEMRSTKMIAAKIVTAILGVGLNFYGASMFGFHGVVATLVIFSCLHFFWIACIAKRKILSSNLHSFTL